jgi:predicted cobalt transporter CbtA
MRSLGAAIAAASLIVSSTFALAATNTSVPLAPGKPAGVKQAQMHDNAFWWIAGVGVVGLGIALVASGNGNNGVVPGTSPTTTTTTTTTTAP